MTQLAGLVFVAAWYFALFAVAAIGAITLWVIVAWLLDTFGERARYRRRV